MIAPSAGAGTDFDGRLEELWRVGGLADGPTWMAPAAFAASENSDLAVVDYQLAEVVVIDSTGEWQDTWTRRGRGPGEIIMPVAAAWKASRLAVFDIEQAKVSFFEDGRRAEADLKVDRAFIAPVIASGEISFVGMRPDGGVLLQYPLGLPQEIAATDLAQVSVLALGAFASRPDTVVTTRTRVVGLGTRPYLIAPGWPVPRIGLGSNGWMGVAAADGTYRILVLDSLDRAVRQLCRHIEPLPLSEAEKGQSLPPRMAHVQEILSELAPPTNLPAVGRLLVGPAGEVWVDRHRPAPFGNMYGVTGTVMDVFDANGRYRGEIRIPSDVSIQAVAGDRAWGLQIGSYDEPWVIGYRINVIDSH